MSESEFNLLKHLQNRQTNVNNIEKQRAVLKELLDANNKLVQEIWKIDRQLAKIKPGEEAEVLVQRKNGLEQQRNIENYPKKIEAQTKKVHDIEVETYGASDVGKSSPYRL